MTGNIRTMLLIVGVCVALAGWGAGGWMMWRQQRPPVPAAAAPPAAQPAVPEVPATPVPAATPALWSQKTSDMPGMPRADMLSEVYLGLGLFCVHTSRLVGGLGSGPHYSLLSAGDVRENVDVTMDESMSDPMAVPGHGSLNLAENAAIQSAMVACMDLPGLWAEHGLAMDVDYGVCDVMEAAITLGPWLGSLVMTGSPDRLVSHMLQTAHPNDPDWIVSGLLPNAGRPDNRCESYLEQQAAILFGEAQQGLPTP